MREKRKEEEKAAKLAQQAEKETKMEKPKAADDMEDVDPTVSSFYNWNWKYFFLRGFLVFSLD